MKKDLKSYARHNKDYEEMEDFYKKEAIIERTEKNDFFTKNGFKYAIKITKKMPDIHVDIGSGVGWLTRKMAPYFKKTIGIEPSHAAILAAKNVTKDIPNVSFIEKDMIDGYKELNPQEPVFFTTGVVLSHIEDYYVEEFLKLINNAPEESVLYFCEKYDRNIQWVLWHIRNQDWWVKNLPNWQLVFLNMNVDNYPSGIYGLCVGKENVLENHKMGFFENIFWKLDGVYSITGRIIKKILRFFKVIE